MIANYPILYGNAKNIAEAEVVFLLESHRNSQDIQKVRDVVEKHFVNGSDHLLVEEFTNLRPHRILRNLLKEGDSHYAIYLRRAIEGWDESASKRVIESYHSNSTVVKFRRSIATVKKASAESDIDELELVRAFSTLVEGLRAVEGDESLYPPSTYEGLIAKKEFASAEFITLRDILVRGGERVLVRIQNVYIAKSFSGRQGALIDKLRDKLSQSREERGRLFVVLGRNHGDLETSSYPKEVQKLIDSVIDKHKLIAL